MVLEAKVLDYRVFRVDHFCHDGYISECHEGVVKLWARQKFRRGKRGGQHHSGLCAMPLCACANAGYM